MGRCCFLRIVKERQALFSIRDTISRGSSSSRIIGCINPMLPNDYLPNTNNPPPGTTLAQTTLAPVDVGEAYPNSLR